MCQFSKCHRTLHFHDTYTSLPITRAEENKHARLKLEEGVCLDLEVRQISEEDEEHTWLDSEEEAHLIEEARLKYEEEEKAWIRTDEEARLAKEASQK